MHCKSTSVQNLCNAPQIDGQASRGQLSYRNTEMRIAKMQWVNSVNNYITAQVLGGTYPLQLCCVDEDVKILSHLPNPKNSYPHPHQTAIITYPQPHRLSPHSLALYQVQTDTNIFPHTQRACKVLGLIFSKNTTCAIHLPLLELNTIVSELVSCKLTSV